MKRIIMISKNVVRQNVDKIVDKVESIWFGILSPYIALVERKEKHKRKIHNNTSRLVVSRPYVIPPHRVPKDIIDV